MGEFSFVVILICMTTKLCKIDGCNNRVIAKELCTKHYLRQRKHGSTDRPKFVREKLIEEGKSYCPKCNETKSLDAFCKASNTAFGISIYCKECQRKKSKVRYKTHKNEHINNGLKKKYGITLVDYTKLLNKQNNQCLICGKKSSESKRRLAVDHDHETGKIRGILCEERNRGIGIFKDSIDRLNNSINYLKIK